MAASEDTYLERLRRYVDRLRYGATDVDEATDMDEATQADLGDSVPLPEFEVTTGRNGDPVMLPDVLLRFYTHAYEMIHERGLPLVAETLLNGQVVDRYEHIQLSVDWGKLSTWFRHFNYQKESNFHLVPLERERRR